MERVDASQKLLTVNDKTELLMKKLEQSGVHKYQSHFHVAGIIECFQSICEELIQIFFKYLAAILIFRVSCHGSEVVAIVRATAELR